MTEHSHIEPPCTSCGRTDDPILSKDEVRRLLKYKHASSVNKLILRDHSFPRPFDLHDGDHSPRWYAPDVWKWINARRGFAAIKHTPARDAMEEVERGVILAERARKRNLRLLK